MASANPKHGLNSYKTTSFKNCCLSAGKGKTGKELVGETVVLQQALVFREEAL